MTLVGDRSHQGMTDLGPISPISPTTLRIPRGLWKDLEETVIQQDRQFLAEVARSLGLPITEVIRKVLGSGAAQTVQVLSGEADTDRCPWWDRIGDGLWRPCCRQRISASQPCQMHGRSSTITCLGVDTRLDVMPLSYPVSHEGIIYWVSEDPDTHVFREDGVIETKKEFKRVEVSGHRVWIVRRI